MIYSAPTPHSSCLCHDDGGGDSNTNSARARTLARRHMHTRTQVCARTHTWTSGTHVVCSMLHAACRMYVAWSYARCMSLDAYDLTYKSNQVTNADVRHAAPTRPSHLPVHGAQPTEAIPSPLLAEPRPRVARRGMASAGPRALRHSIPLRSPSMLCPVRLHA